MSDELHKLAFEYRNAGSYTDTVRAYAALEAYEASLMEVIAVQTRRNLQRTAREMGLAARPATHDDIQASYQLMRQSMGASMTGYLQGWRDAEVAHGIKENEP